MEFKKVITALLLLSAVLVIVMSMIGSCYAITASIGNARMVLRANVSDTIERSVLVKNVNNETVKIESFVSGDLAKNMILKNANFTLAPNQEKNIDFKVKITQNGTTETKINIAFNPMDGKSGGVGLTSTIIIIAGGESIDDSDTDTGNTTSILDFFNNFKIGNLGIALITTAAIFAVFVVVLILYVRNSHRISEHPKIPNEKQGFFDLKKNSKKGLKEVKLNKPTKS
jgi:hypothetical protein